MNKGPAKPSKRSDTPRARTASGKGGSDKRKNGKHKNRKPESGKPVPGLLARDRAVRALFAVLRDGRPLEIDDDGLDPRDLALARKIAGTTLRRLGSLRTALAACLDGPGLPDKGALEAILLTAACQILLLNTPTHSAVDLAVRLTGRQAATQRYRGLVNAVLRALARRRDDLAPGPMSPADTPDWLRDRWTAGYGPDRTQEILARHAEEPALDITCKDDAAGWADRLGGVSLPTGGIRLPAGGRIADLQGYAEGAWWVQDAAASLPARLLGDVSGRAVADLCAAPGGKTAQLAAAGAAVTAVDIAPQRLTRLADNLARLRLTATLVEADLRDWRPGRRFEAVLLDAPCSATGTIRRHPEVAWLRRPDDIARLAALQTELLDRALDLVTPGGVLVYATCSLEPEEGDRRIADLLERRPDVTVEPVTAAEIGGLSACVTPDGFLRTLPCHLTPADIRGTAPPRPAGTPETGGQIAAATAPGAGMDGFFAARLRLDPSDH